MADGYHAIGANSLIEGSIVVPLRLVYDVSSILKARKLAFPGESTGVAHRGDATISHLTGIEGWKAIHLSRSGMIIASERMSDLEMQINEELQGQRKDTVTLKRIGSLNGLSVDQINELLASSDGSTVYYVPDLMSTSPITRSTRTTKVLDHWISVEKASREAKDQFTFCELFAGIGGFRLGLVPLGGRCVMASEIDARAAKRYMINHGEDLLSDINGIGSMDLPPFDLLVGGFPCQSYCRLAVDPKGLRCSNGQLIHNIVRLLVKRQPKGFLLENVPNLLSVNDGRDLESIIEALTACGYHVEYKCIDARSFGVPQQRIRVYFVGIRQDLVDKSRDRIQWPVIPDPPILTSHGVVEDESLRLRNFLEILDEVRLARYQLDPVRWDRIMKKETHPTLSNAELTGRRLANLDGYARTLVSTYRSGMKLYSEFVPVPGGPPRLYTPRECARLMGFPESFQLPSEDDGQATQAYHQLGNAVVPIVIESIVASALLPYLKDEG